MLMGPAKERPGPRAYTLEATTFSSLLILIHDERRQEKQVFLIKLFWEAY